MRKSLLFLSVVAGILITCSVSQATLQGPASDYNVFLFDDMNVWRSDSQGRVAAGGDITMSNYAVGLLASPAKYSMISGEMSDLVPDQSSMGGFCRRKYSVEEFR